jgi:hypothetical protein
MRVVLPLILRFWGGGMLAVSAGCAREVEPPASRPVTPFTLGRRVMPPPPARTLLVEGTLPLVYHFVQGGPLRLADAVEHGTLWSGTVPPDVMIMIDGTGVRLGGQRLATLPLDPRRRYELWFEPPQGTATPAVGPDTSR